MAANWSCDGGQDHTHGEVRVYPLGGGANLILCAACWRHENRYRADRARETGNPDAWPQVAWDTAKTYPE